MDAAVFETLAQKVELAVARLAGLKEECDGLKVELDAARERQQALEGELAKKDGEIEGLRGELGARQENLALAGDRVRDLVTRLDAALA